MLNPILWVGMLDFREGQVQSRANTDKCHFSRELGGNCSNFALEGYKPSFYTF